MKNMRGRFLAFCHRREKCIKLKRKNRELTDEELAMRVSGNSIVVNIALSLLKFTAGIIGRSGAMISDAVHSTSDVFSTVIVMIGVKISNKASDEKHQYGHERLECVASILLAVILCLTGFGIGMSGIHKIALGNQENLAMPGVMALTAAVISIVVKEGMYWYTRAAAKKTDSGVLMADAWHHRSDALSSVGSFVGIFGARLGWKILDPIASVVICMFIIKASCDIFRDAVGKMTDESCDNDLVDQIKNVILDQDGVIGLDDIKTRVFGAKIYVDIEICADGKKTLEEAHQVAEQVHSAVEQSFPKVKHCMVHVNPCEELEETIQTVCCCDNGKI